MIALEKQQLILSKLSAGLTISENPFLDLALELDVSESELIDFIKQSIAEDRIKRVGMVINHHRVGYSANAMVVWNVPDSFVDELGEILGQEEKVTLCYQRSRVLPDWPYNLFTMIHGKDRDQVLSQLNQIKTKNKLENIQSEVLFSTKKFKQTGAHYGS